MSVYAWWGWLIVAGDVVLVMILAACLVYGLYLLGHMFDGF